MIKGLLGALRGVGDQFDFIPGFDPDKDKSGLISQLIGRSAQTPPIVPQGQMSAPGGANPFQQFAKPRGAFARMLTPNTYDRQYDAGHQKFLAEQGKRFTAQQAQAASQRADAQFIQNAQAGGFTPEQIAKMQMARNANPEEFGKSFAGNFGFNTVSEGNEYSRFGGAMQKNAKTPTPIDPSKLAIDQQNADASTLTAEAAMMRAKNPSSMVSVHTGDGLDPRPVVDKPSKDFQRIWDEDSGTYRDDVIPGTQTARERELLNSKAFQALQANNEQFDAIMTNIDAADELISPFTAGVGSYMEGLRGTPARDLAARMETVKANIGFDKLNEMRQTSPTGGALGQVTERELNFLQSVRGSLDEGQSPAQLRETLGEIKASLQRLQEVREIAFKLEQQNAAEGQIVSTEPLVSGDLPDGFALQDDDADLLEFMTPEERALFQGGAQ